MAKLDTDELLLERAGAGDPAAFLELYERHRTSVFRFAYRLSGTVETAEDITHDCFLSLITRPGNFRRDRASLRTYLLSAARNLWLKQLRKTGRESALGDFPEDGFIAGDSQPIISLLANELAQTVKEAVSNLPPLQKEALVLFEYEGLALVEIAEMVGTDVGAVKSRLYRARESLKHSLKPYLSTNREIVTVEKA